MSERRWIAIAMVMVALTGVLAGGCGKTPVAAKPGGRITIVATTGMVADLARVVGGDRVLVTALMGEGVDPHLYRPTPGDLRMLEQADLILYNGLLLEGRMADVFERMGTRKPTVAVTAKIDRARVHAKEGATDHDDPHVWFDVAMWSQAVEAVREALVKADARGGEKAAAEYAERAERYRKELLDLDAWCRAELGTIPAERRVLITAHDAFGYFGKAYGVEVRGIQGVSTDSEASMPAISGLVELIVSRKVSAVFVESSVPRKTVEALVEGAKSRGHTVRIGGELFSDAMGADGTPEGTYVGMVRHNVRTIVEALR